MVEAWRKGFEVLTSKTALVKGITEKFVGNALDLIKPMIQQDVIAPILHNYLATFVFKTAKAVAEFKALLEPFVKTGFQIYAYTKIEWDESILPNLVS